ncbi:MAG: response regulator [Lachnospiraceae bacterium]|nr:response regulator [Lachnospiraceae bacterium]
MYKVVIIDDEPVIVEGLSRTVHWDKWECQVVGTAYSGDEGIELIRQKKPDIIITDISMPGKSGLVMIAGIRSEFPDTRVTILTGYRDFDYAREAIRLGVDRFLLKPSRMDELEGAVECMTQHLKKQGIWPEKTSEASQEDERAEASKNDPAEDVLYNNAASSFIVKNAVTYIKEHYQEKLRLNDVADQIYVSQWHLSKLLNRHTGKNFSEILNGIRIEKAKELLHDPSRRIGDVAEAVGFQDLAHFSRVFKNHEGISANEYRNTL